MRTDIFIFKSSPPTVSTIGRRWVKHTFKYHAETVNEQTVNNKSFKPDNNSFPHEQNNINVNTILTDLSRTSV